MLGSDENRLPQPGDQNSSTLEYLFRQMIETQLKRDKRQEERDEKFQQMLEAQIKRDKRQEERDEQWRKEQNERDEKFQQMLEAQLKRDKRQEERDEQWRKEQNERDEKWRKEQNERDEKWRKEQEERDNALHGKLDKLTTAIGDLSGKQAEVVPPQPIQQPPADELLEPQPRDIHDPFKTPSKQIKPRPSSLVASNTTPYGAIQKTHAYTREHYAKLGCDSSRGISCDIEGFFKNLGPNWVSAWMDACHDGSSCQEILRTTWREYQAYSGFCNMKPEEIRQKKLGVFFTALEAHPRFQNGSHQQLRWSDQHKTPMSNRRKPDGILFASSPGRAANWQNTAVAIEVKDENSTSNSNVLMGQLFQDFLDMAEDQPRHFVIGLTISGDYEANAWLCTPSNLFNCRLGKLLSDKPDFEHHNFVYFLFVLYQQLPKDYGFLVNNRYGLTSAFSVADMLSSTANSGYFEDKMIAIEGGKAFSGRHNVLSGSRSWVYYARIEVPEGQSERVIFKFHWHGVGRSEADVHRQVLNTGVPYVPQLLYSSGIDTRIESLLFNEYTGEILIIEDCGMGLWQFADSVIDKDCCRLIDMFAGYVHTLLAASTTHPAKFVLHRDISLNNLMVKHGEPRIIDWGCGLVVNRGTTRLPSEAIIMGTAPYMGIRVLSENKTRTLLDDLESLFLVFSYVLWTKYGIVDETYRILWSGEKDMVAILHRRYSWLSSGVEFIAQMQLGNKLAPELKEFALNLYELLFSTGARTLSNQESDSRAEDFDAKKWLDAFKLSTKKAKDADMPYLGRLEAYVMNITRHDIGLSHKKNKRKASHADLNSEKLSPTRHAKH